MTDPIDILVVGAGPAHIDQIGVDAAVRQGLAGGFAHPAIGGPHKRFKSSWNGSILAENRPKSLEKSRNRSKLLTRAP